MGSGQRLTTRIIINNNNNKNKIGVFSLPTLLCKWLELITILSPISLGHTHIIIGQFKRYELNVKNYIIC